MTSVTPVYGLEYPNALDEPCDFPEDWCTFTADVDAVIGRFELGASRVLPAIPIAKVQVTEQVVLPEFAVVPFDTVSIDTAGWTNFDNNNQIITVSRTARYTLCATAIVASQGVANVSWSLSINNGFFSSVETLDRNTNDVAISVQGTGPLFSGDQISLSLLAGTSLPNGFTLRTASLAVYWHADEERAS